MRLEQLNYFVEVSRCQSISLAASRLFMSQQNISTGIRKLEAELGFDLFERTHQGVTLTEQGQKVLVRAEEILRQVDGLMMMAQPTEEQLTGELRVEMVPYIALPGMIVDFYRHNPAATIKTTEKSPSEIITDVMQDETDIGFVYLREGEQLETPGLVQEKLSKDQLYFCVSKKLNYPKRNYTASELFQQKLPLIVFNSLYDWTMDFLSRYEQTKPLVYRADVQLYRKMILEGLATGFSTKAGIEQEMVFIKGEVDTMKLSGFHLIVCMLYKETPTFPLKKGFINVVRDYFGKMHTNELHTETD